MTRRHCCCSPAPCCVEDLGIIGFVGSVPSALNSDCCCNFDVIEDLGVGISPLPLAIIDALFSHVSLGDCSAWSWPFSTADAALIAAWVFNGGRLFMFDEYDGCRIHFDPAEYAKFYALWQVLSGTTVNDDTLYSGCVNYGPTADLTDMPQPDVAFGASCSINIGTSATPIAWTDSEKEDVLISGTAYGSGFIFNFADTNIYGNDCSVITSGYNCGLMRYLMTNPDPLV